MTIELTTDDLAEVQEQANRYGACVLKVKTTEGDDVWVAVQNQRASVKRRPRTVANAEPTPATVTQ